MGSEVSLQSWGVNFQSQTTEETCSGEEQEFCFVAQGSQISYIFDNKGEECNTGLHLHGQHGKSLIFNENGWEGLPKASS